VSAKVIDLASLQTTQALAALEAAHMRKPWTATYVKVDGVLVCKIPLSQGLFALIDSKYLDDLLLYSWYALRDGNTYYAKAWTWGSDGCKKLLSLHKVIWELHGKPEGPVDHKNSDGLDCRVRNLRPGPVKLNAANKRKQAGASSKYKGVSWNKRWSKWHAQICVAGQRSHLGVFAKESQAARAYDKAASAAWGEYAKLNFPEECAA
jgi:hypothetical protein